MKMLYLFFHFLHSNSSFPNFISFYLSIFSWTFSRKNTFPFFYQYLAYRKKLIRLSEASFHRTLQLQNTLKKIFMKFSAFFYIFLFLRISFNIFFLRILFRFSPLWFWNHFFINVIKVPLNDIFINIST